LKPHGFLLAIIVGTGFFSMCVAPTIALAQSAGTISGTVTDGAGVALGNARVAIFGPVSTEVTTKPDGTYSVSVPPGIYSVAISAAGFQSTRQDNIAIVAGQSVSLKTSLANASLTTIGHTSTSATAVSSSPVMQQTIGAATILNQGQDQVVNVLDQIPGVEIYRWGGGSNEPGSNASISIRGAEPYESQVLLDGHPVNTAGNGTLGFNTAFINSLLVSNIEVSEGPGGLTNTVENAVGGTVNFRTAPITATPTSAFMTGYDSFNTFTYALRFSDTIGKIGFLVGAARETTPGYLTPQYLWGADNYYSPEGVPVYPNPRDVFGPGATYVGVLNFRYPATSDFSSDSQLVKLAYNFSPVTSLQFSSYSTQAWLDETGNNEGNINATIVPCIYASGTMASGTCPVGGNPAYYNYTANPYLGNVGKTVPINYYAAYPNTYEFDNEPIYTGEFRTVIGPGSFLARYYAGSVSRTVTQGAAPYAISPCYTPACQWVVTETGLPGTASDYNDNGYPGEPYTEPTLDVLHGFDAQYTLPIGPNTITLGFDRHVDQSTFEELYALGYWPYDTTPGDYYTLTPGSTKYFTIASTSESVRGSFQLAPALQLDAGGYFSNTSYVGSRVDPRGGLTFKPNANTSLRASWGSAYVAPYYGLVNATEEVHDGSLLVPTTTFSPETSTSWDLGADFKYSRDSLVSLDLYDTTIYNRYATVIAPVSGTFDGHNYSSETINSSQGDGRQAGIELSVLHQPRFGFGYHVGVDLLRDYSYNQVPVAASAEDLFFKLPDNGVQLPGFPYSKGRGDLWYTFHGGDSLRFSGTTYGANNAFGQAGFTVFDAALTLPTRPFLITIGARNLFNKDDYQVGGVYYGGYTYAALGGGIGPTNLEYFQPRTVYMELSRTTGF
jgi:outer membrane receptor protein involved in Fe transport